ncbi:MAG: o-succinylbenzoate synthase, partial [Chitinophagaceae bacterium]
DHAKLAAQLKTPICLDESITSITRATQAIEIGACGFINIKPGRVGGVTNALEILSVARNNNIPCWIGGMFESAIGASHCTALATLPGMGYAADIFPSTRFVSRDITEHNIELYAPGKVAAFEGVGIGCIPDSGQLKEVTVQSFEFVA